MSKASESFVNLNPLKGKQFSSRYKRNSVGGFIQIPGSDDPSLMPAIFSNQALQDRASESPNVIDDQFMSPLNQRGDEHLLSVLQPSVFQDSLLQANSEMMVT